MRRISPIKAAALAGALALTGGFGGGGSALAEGEVTISHYFSGELGRAGLEKIFAKFQETKGSRSRTAPSATRTSRPGSWSARPAGTSGRVQLLGRGTHAVRRRRRQPGDDRRDVGRPGARLGRREVRLRTAPPCTTAPATWSRSAITTPGLFYNTKVMAEAGVTGFPTTWSGFMALCADLKAKGVAPIALGSKKPLARPVLVRLPAARTAGPDYRAKLMAGEAAYTDDEVKAAMALWKELVDAGYFTPNANADGLDRRLGQGCARGCGDDPDGHLDHRVLERQRPHGGRRLRLLRVPGDRRRGPQRGRGAGGRAAHLGQRAEPRERRGAARLPRLGRGVAGHVGPGAGRPVAQRRGRREHLHPP